MVYDQFVDTFVQFNDSINIMLNGSRLIWSNCVKHLGNYTKYEHGSNIKESVICLS